MSRSSAAVRRIIPTSTYPTRLPELKIYRPEPEFEVDSLSEVATRPALASNKVRRQEAPILNPVTPGRNGTDSTSGSPPPPPITIFPLPNKSSNSPLEDKGTLVPIIATFLGSCGLAGLTHFREDTFDGIQSGLTKVVKIGSTFLAMFTGTIGIAAWLTSSPNDSNAGNDFSLSM